MFWYPNTPKKPWKGRVPLRVSHPNRNYFHVGFYAKIQAERFLNSSPILYDRFDAFWGISIFG